MTQKVPELTRKRNTQCAMGAGVAPAGGSGGGRPAENMEAGRGTSRSLEMEATLMEADRRCGRPPNVGREGGETKYHYVKLKLVSTQPLQA